MKKLLPFFLLFIFLKNVKGQNTYDTYSNNCQYPAVDVLSGTNLAASPTGGYSGEYQIFLNEHPWRTSPTLNTNTISYKIEVVSFPFTTNCFSCQSSNPSPDRKLIMPDINFPYNQIEKAWVRNTSVLPPPIEPTNELKLRREFYGKYAAFIAYQADENIHFSTLISYTVTRPGDESHGYREFYPHSVLKHTFYMHCGNQITDPIIDSFSFVLDHTRGLMRKYPFKATNSPFSAAPEHDITIFPKWLNASEASFLNTTNYYTIPYGMSTCNNHFGTSYIWDENNFIRPQPNTLLQVFLANAGGSFSAGQFDENTFMPGIPHQYIIDRSIDLTILNPSEKIIYNPSEVDIDLNQPFNTTPASKTLIFPNGYTFKTVQGTYPSLTQIAAADPDNLYYDKRNVPLTNLSCDDVGPTNDGIFSYYRVKNGSTLIIEPCVSIYDTKIIVESGGTLLYNKNLVYGRFDVENQGGTININYNYPYLPSIPNTCACDCYELTKYDVKNIDITSNTTWTSAAPFDNDNDGIVRIAGTLRITTGKTLTINGGIHFEFGENGKVVVERGAKFIINSTTANPSTFENASICKNSMWQGIEVWGETNNHHQLQNGLIEFTNVKISDARNAITTSRSEPVTGSDNLNNYYGGLVRCYNVEFKNNFRDAEFLPYQNFHVATGTEVNNFSYFINCQFKTTNKLKDQSYIAAGGRLFCGYEHVKLTDVKHVRFSNCLFENSAVKTDGSSLFDVDLRSTGIRGFNSSFGISGGAVKNTFKGLSDGIWLSNTDIDYITIHETDFINNIHSVTLEGTTYSSLKYNNFEIPAHEDGGQLATSGYNKPVGLYMIGATKFAVEENTFKNYGTPVTGNEQPGHFNYGMVVNNSVGISEDGYANAYKNNFQNLNINLQTELNNKGGQFDQIPGTGFMYKCNDFNTRKNTDVTVVGKNGISGLLREQGVCISSSTQAGNNYTTGCVSDEQLQFDTDAEFYNQAEFKYSDQPGKLTCINPNLSSSIDECNGFSTNNPCPSTYCPTFPCAIAEYNSGLAALAQANNVYKQLVDGGNTQNLLNSINGNMAPGQLKNLLMSKSPYLSDTVLIAMLKKGNPLPPGHIQQIIIANSPLTKKVLAVVNETNLPTGIKNIILSAQAGISARSEKESEVDYYAFEKNRKELNLLQLYLEVDNLDSLKKIAQKDTSLLGLFKLMEVLLAQGDLVGAQTCRADIISKESPHISDRCKFLSMQLNLALNGKTWFDIDSIQTAKLTEIYLNNPETAIYARNVLAMVKGLRYEKYPFDIVPVRRGIVNSENENLEEKAENNLKIYPNPANNYLTIKAKSNNLNTFNKIQIINSVGIQIDEIILKPNETELFYNTTNLKSGIYILLLINDDILIDKSKVIINH